MGVSETVPPTRSAGNYSSTDERMIQGENSYIFLKKPFFLDFLILKICSINLLFSGWLFFLQDDENGICVWELIGAAVNR